MADEQKPGAVYQVPVEVKAGQVLHIMVVACGRQDCRRVVTLEMGRDRGGVHTGGARYRLEAEGWRINLTGVSFCPDHAPKKKKGTTDAELLPQS